MLRNKKAIAISLLILGPATVFAQRGGGGGRTRGEQRADFGSVMNANSGGLAISNRDVEDISPIKLLIDKRKDLKLSDEQVKGLKDSENKLKDDVRESFRALDSIRRAAAPPARDPTDEDRGRMMEARRTAMAVVTTIRAKYDAAVQEALPRLDESQRKTAGEMLEKQHQDAEEMLREKFGGRGRR